MNVKGLLTEILNAVVNHERDKVKTQKPDYYLNQKKLLWYGMMNRVDDSEDAGGKKDES